MYFEISHLQCFFKIWLTFLENSYEVFAFTAGDTALEKYLLLLKLLWLFFLKFGENRISFQNHISEQCLYYSAEKRFNLCSVGEEGEAISLLSIVMTVGKAAKFCFCFVMSARSGEALAVGCELHFDSFRKLESVFRVKFKVMPLVRAVPVKQICYSCWRCPPFNRKE